MDDGLIFDVGMGNGDDTAFYLSQGYRVVAVEADPDRCAAARTRFASELGSGRLVVEEVAIAGSAGNARFYVTRDERDFSALDRSVASRAGHAVREITVATAPLSALFAAHGVPYYLKVDIEGSDGACLEALQGLSVDELPRYVSVEAHKLGYLCELWTVGYRRFKVIDQAAHNDPRAPISRETRIGRLRHALRYHARANPRLRAHYLRRTTFPEGSSGPFGEATAGEWLDLETVAYEWLHVQRGHTDRGHLPPGTWFDFHAAL